jgi:tetratricopeptide (TPR) repeat protein
MALFRFRSLGLVVAFGLLWSLGVTPAAFAAKDTDKQAELKARQAFAASRYDEAIEIFAQLYAETLNPIYLRNIGRCHQKKREPEKAIDTFQDYLAKGKSITPSEKKEIQGYIKEMEQLRDEQAKEREAAAAKAAAAAATPPTTGPGYSGVSPNTSTVNGIGSSPNGITTLPPPNDPGTATLVATPGSRQPPEESRPIYKRWWFWTAIGVVAAGGVAAALLIPGGVTKPPCTIAECK